MIRVRIENVIEVRDWDNLVTKTYGRPYSFQQQNGCMERQRFQLTIPSDYTEDEDMHDSIPEVVNGNKQGVKFDVWLSRDPIQKLESSKVNNKESDLIFFWKRSFYPDIYTVANDLHEKGLIDAGDYSINIDW